MRIHVHPCRIQCAHVGVRGDGGLMPLPEVGVGVCGDLHVVDERQVLVAVDRQADVVDGAVGELEIVVKLA